MNYRNEKIKDTDTAIQLVKGGIRYDFMENVSVEEGELLSAYVGDHKIGEALIFQDETTHRYFTVIGINDMPAVEFPATVRASLGEDNVQLPDFTIDNKDELVPIVPWSSLESRFCAISPESITCEVAGSSLARYSRHFGLVVNDAEPVIVESEIKISQASELKEFHTIEFNIDFQIKTEDSVKIIDIASNECILELEANWQYIANVLMRQASRVSQALSSANARIASLEKRIDLISTLSLEKITLERLDLYHSILNARIDRLQNLLSEHNRNINVDGLQEEDHQTNYTNISVSEIEGTGLYQVESNEVSKWRWIGPRATFAFKDLIKQPRVVVFYLASVITNERQMIIDAMVNGTVVSSKLEKTNNGIDLQVPIFDYAWRNDRILIITLHLSEYKQFPNDERIMSAVLRSVQIQY